MNYSPQIDQASQNVNLQDLAGYKQRQFCLKSSYLKKDIYITSKFESGNLNNCQLLQSPNLQIKLWIGGDTNSVGYRTWFYFGIQGINMNQTVTFIIMNMSNQIKLFKQGHTPVYKAGNSKTWQRIRVPMQQNSVVKSENGYQVTFRHNFSQNSMHYFAFTYPWTLEQNDNMINQEIRQLKNTKSESKSYYCQYSPICQSFMNNKINMLVLTNNSQQSKIQQIPLFDEDNEINQKMVKKIVSFHNKKGVFISARVHPGQISASHTLNGFIKELFTNMHKIQINEFLKKFVLYIVPILNPDGVALGNFRTDAFGKNLNRYYTDPSPKQQPQIYYIKNMLSKMIKKNKIDFCLDLHGHVNKQGAFIYGNYLNNLKNQTEVLLFPKILSFNSEIFDFEACNFTDTNMGTNKKNQKVQEDKEKDKEGSARVAIYKQTGLNRCWTLQCNYNSAKFINLKPALTHENKNSSVSHGLLCNKLQPQIKEETKLFNIEQFQNLGKSILYSIVDYYQIRHTNHIFGTKIRNMENLRVNVAIAALRLLPFRFDGNCRKLLVNISGQIQLKQTISKIWSIVNSIPRNMKVAESKGNIQIKLQKMKVIRQQQKKIKKIQKQNNERRNSIISIKQQNINKQNSINKKIRNLGKINLESQKVLPKQKTQQLPIQSIGSVKNTKNYTPVNRSKRFVQKAKTTQTTEKQIIKVENKRISVKLPVKISNNQAKNCSANRSTSLYRDLNQQKVTQRRKDASKKSTKRNNIKLMLEKQSQLLKKLMADQ